MKLYGSLTSPFVRACRIGALELGLNVDFEPIVVKPTEANRAFGDAINPLRRVPALETDDGTALVDSRVILEYMNDVAGGGLIPTASAARISCLNRHAIGAGATEALVAAMYETKFRPEAVRWDAWADDQVDKAQCALDWIEARAADYSTASDAPLDIAAISVICLVGYGFFRFPDVDWYAQRPNLKMLNMAWAERPSIRESTPPTS